MQKYQKWEQGKGGGERESVRNKIFMPGWAVQPGGPWPVRIPDQGKMMPRDHKNAYVLDEMGWTELVALLSQKILAVVYPVAFQKFRYDPNSPEAADDVLDLKAELIAMCECELPLAESRLH
jgi:hypothetical protein